MEMLEKVKIELGSNFKIGDDVIQYYINKCTDIALGATGYIELPSSLECYVVSAVVECINRRENEGTKSKSALGVSTTFSYNDIEESLRNKVKGKRNPMNLIGRY